MDMLEFGFWALLFFALGLLAGKLIVSFRLRVVYTVVVLLYALLMVEFLGVNLNFPLGVSTLESGDLAPYWLVLMALSGRFLLIGACLSFSHNLFKVRT